MRRSCVAGMVLVSWDDSCVDDDGLADRDRDDVGVVVKVSSSSSSVSLSSSMVV